jgi:hypothetical protein
MSNIWYWNFRIDEEKHSEYQRHHEFLKNSEIINDNSTSRVLSSRFELLTALKRSFRSACRYKSSLSELIFIDVFMISLHLCSNQFNLINENVDFSVQERASVTKTSRTRNTIYHENITNSKHEWFDLSRRTCILYASSSFI